jgi:hypothetical protein
MGRPGEACLDVRRECSLTTESKAEGPEAGRPLGSMGHCPLWRRLVGGRGGAVFKDCKDSRDCKDGL